ncbi:ATP-binding cassette domain-containing protein, partial [Micromonospora sp. NPDC049799]|uniref:ATP-binding cassette domain-containing protein n=1 Tax=Micromonospora sp. NPDC049799 TaxID=3154741 RepID=UPI0033FAE0AB
MDDGLALHHVGVRFGGLTALDDVSLRVPPGRVVGVIGPNGAGKTTLFNVICGFVRPGSGSLTLDGRPLRPRPHRLTRLGIARTLQGAGLFAGLTVLENVMAGATHSARAGFLPALLGLPRSDRDEDLLRRHALDVLAGLGIA